MPWLSAENLQTFALQPALNHISGRATEQKHLDRSKETFKLLQIEYLQHIKNDTRVIVSKEQRFLVWAINHIELAEMPMNLTDRLFNCL